MSIAKGQAFSLAIYLVSAAIILISIYRARSSGAPDVREIPGLKAIEEAVGRATEMGKPVHYSLGIGGLVKSEGPQTLASLSVLSHVATLAARYNVRLIVSICQPEVFPVASDIVRASFNNEGHADLFKDDTVRFLSSNQFAYAAGVMGLLQREKVAANIMMGWFAGESLLLSEAGHDAGGIQIAGTANISQVPYFVASCDYTLIGEEIFVASAVLSRDAVQLGSIRGQDIVKALVWVMVVVGAVSRMFGSKWLVDLMSV